MENFIESLNKLKEVHEKEVLGLQNKLLELNSERCRDAQRVEELFAKNHQLREQQKGLKENLRVLENRLRAGLCDRCMVTQEVARKRQLEFESVHLQSLQRICVLTNEITRLKEENKMLKEEVKHLRSLEDRPPPLAREAALDSPSPLLLSPAGSRKASTEKPQAGHEEAEEDLAGTGPAGEEKSAGCRTSPATKISPGGNLPELRAAGMSPQRISNQLHATVAVVRPGSRACLTDHSPTDGTSPPPSRSSPSSPGYEHTLPLDSLLRASGSSVPAYESLKRPLQADRFCLLNRHLSLHLRSLHSSLPAPASAPPSPQPWVLKAGEAWDEPAGLLGLPGTLVGTQDPRLEGALHLLLAQQQLCARVRAGGDTLRGLPPRRGTPPSPPVGSDSDSLEHEVPGAALTTAGLPGGQNPWPTGSSLRKEAVATQDYASDKPLDLSGPGRSKGAHESASQSRPLSPNLAHPRRPEALTLPRPLPRSPQTLSNGTQGATELEPEGPPTPAEPSQPLPRTHLSLLTAADTRERSRPAPSPQSPQTATPPEPSQAGVQRSESEELDESDTSDSEVSLSFETGAKLSAPGEEHRCFCPWEPQQGLQQKRRQALDPTSKASKKPCRGRSKAAEGPGSPRSAKDCSPSPGHSGPEET
ncbi:PREDICTED: RBBP8 N-terminal-like protein isoform X2 [Chinchilla lanigera]|nr:PREDICTED: RBBP8 N-terminal-like protein isoform X2 [Chinchilla lanigera]XP_013362951.1 PREDICTED: RBBP8 N-terminal-like protein isoform X2 [Chinchilla lanigera]